MVKMAFIDLCIRYKYKYGHSLLVFFRPAIKLKSRVSVWLCGMFKYAVTYDHIGDAKSNAHVEKCMILTLATTLRGVRMWPVKRKNVGPNLIYPHLLVVVQIPKAFILDSLYNRTYSIILVNVFPYWKCMNCLPVA